VSTQLKLNISYHLNFFSYIPYNAVVCGSMLLEGTVHVSP